MIVDASAFITILGKSRAVSALHGADLSAPDLLIPEALNALWKAARGGKRVPQVGVVLDLLDRIHILPSRPYAARAAALAAGLDHPVYDCLYLAAAEMLGDTLLTANERLARKLRKNALRDCVRLVR
jgi:predicted nucleic acid-binding protein